MLCILVISNKPQKKKSEEILAYTGEDVDSEDLGLTTNFQLTLVLFHLEALYFSCMKWNEMKCLNKMELKQILILMTKLIII